MLSRRSFLTTAAKAGVGSALFAGSLTRLPLVAAAPLDDTGLLPHFIAGTVTAVRDGRITVDATDLKVIAQVLVSAATQVCKGECGAKPELISVGDLVECGTEFDQSGSRVANWVNVNPRYGHGVVVAVSSNAIQLEDDHAIDAPRNLRIASYTRVLSPEGADVTPDWQKYVLAGTPLFYTGSAETADPDNVNYLTHLVTLATATEAT